MRRAFIAATAATAALSTAAVVTPSASELAVPPAAITLAADHMGAAPPTSMPARLPIEGELPSLDRATEWLNSDPLTAAALRGKVVLVDFWTYSCINWLRSLPYVRAWAEKYKDRGLVVIGVHTPEFAFEKNLGNVGRAAQEMRVDYPIAVDSDYRLWRAFDNQYWPALYIIDAQGHIRHHQFGEGGYEQSETVIQQLLAEAGAAGIDHATVSIDARGAEAAADWDNLRSPENYLGHARTENFASPGGVYGDAPNLYRTIAALPLNRWTLAGVWTIGAEFALLNDKSGSISYRFHARDLHLVLAPAAPDQPIRFRVTIDGAPPGADHGIDVDAEGWGSVREPRLHQLVRQTRPVADRTFQIEFFGAGVRAYAFTFG